MSIVVNIIRYKIVYRVQKSSLSLSKVVMNRIIHRCASYELYRIVKFYVWYDTRHVCLK